MVKQIVVDPCSGMILKNTKESNIDTCYNMDESQKHDAK